MIFNPRAFSVFWRKEKNMKLNCEIIKDLLPLYNDNVCSEESKAAVEEHLKECEPCRTELSKIKDSIAVNVLRREDDSLIIGKYKRILLKKLLFLAICAVFLPFLNAFFSALTGCYQYFFFFASLIAFVSFVYIPAAVQHKRSFWITVSSLANPVLMITFSFIFDVMDVRFTLIPIWIYCLFSLVLFLINRKRPPLKPTEYRSTGLKIMLIETVFICFNVYINALSHMMNTYEGVLRWGGLLTAYFLLFIWLAFAVFRLCKGDVFIKIGMYTVIIGFFISTWDTFNDYIYSNRINEAFWKADFFHPSPLNSSSNTYLAILIISLLTAGVFIGIGVVRGRKIKRYK